MTKVTLQHRVAAAERRVKQLEEALAQVGYTSDGRHIIDFDEQGWAIQHPVECRPQLLDCPVNRAMMFVSRPPTEGEGRYYVSMDEEDHLYFVASARLTELEED